jgi:hypothetical protein
MGWLIRYRKGFQLDGRKLVAQKSWILAVGTKINSVGHHGPASDHVTAALFVVWLNDDVGPIVAEEGGIGTASTLRSLTRTVFEKFDEGKLPQLREIRRRV